VAHWQAKIQILEHQHINKVTWNNNRLVILSAFFLAFTPRNWCC